METPTQTVTADSLAAELPAVNPAAVAAAENPNPGPTVQPAEPKTPEQSQERFSVPTNEPAELDDKGNPFDPDRHIHKKHPKSGVWMPKKPKKSDAAANPMPEGRDKSSGSFVPPDEPAPPPLPGPESLGEYRLAAESACAITFTLGITLGGEEWIPSRDEKSAMANAWEAYLQSQGMKDVPPGVALCIAILGYAGPRFTRPKTQGRLQKLVTWWKSKRAERRGAAIAKEVQPEAGR